MTPTAGMFRWSFRWLPFFHLVPGDLRGGSLAFKAGVTDPGYSGAWTCRLDRRRSVDLPHDRFVRFSAHLDSDWTGCGLVVFRVPAARFRISLLGTRRRSRFARCSPRISAFRRTAEFRATIFLKNSSNLRRSIRSGFISVCIHGRSLPIVQQTNPNRSAKRYGREALRCGPDCDSSMATARSAPQV